MKKWYNKFFLNNIRKAVQKYNLIENGDKILIGLSGGKDSIFLLYSLLLLRQNSYLRFDIAGIHIDIGINTDMKPIELYLKRKDIPYIYENINIIDKIFKDKRNPCFICSKIKRGALARIAKQKGFNKIALGHHQTDLVNTFLLNIVYTGQFHTFKPNSYNEKHTLNLIRPLIYIKEDVIQKIVYDENLPLGKGELCPQDALNKRKEIDILLNQIKEIYPNFEEKFVTAIENFDKEQLWI